MSWIFKDAKDRPSADPKSAQRKAALFALPFAAAGLIALILLMHDGLMGGLNKEMAIKLASVVVVSGGFVALIFGVVAKKSSLAARLEISRSEDEKPWLKRPDWAAGRIKSAGIPHAKSYLIMGIALCALGGLIAALILPKAIHDKNYSEWVAVIFPVVGIAFLISVIKKFLAHGRFGDCFFQMTQTPAPIGGALEGTIQTTLPLEWAGELHLKLFCVRKTTSGAGQNRRTDEKILWQDGTIFKSPADLPRPKSGAGEIPVRFDLPPSQPECSERGNEAVCWRLEMKMPAANFHATFDVPVFRLPAATDATPKSG